MRFLNLISWYYDFYVGFVWTCLITLVSGLKYWKWVLFVVYSFFISWILVLYLYASGNYISIDLTTFVWWEIVEKEIKLKFQNFNFSVILIHKDADSIRSKIYVISLFFVTLCSIWIMKRISIESVKIYLRPNFLSNSNFLCFLIPLFEIQLESFMRGPISSVHFSFPLWHSHFG